MSSILGEYWRMIFLSHSSHRPRGQAFWKVVIHFSIPMDYENLQRMVEELEALRERTSLLQEEIVQRQSDRMNRNMYMLSIAAAIFLPLSFLTGLLGMNVGGIPLAEETSGFILVSSLMIIVGATMWVILKFSRLLS